MVRSNTQFSHSSGISSFPCGLGQSSVCGSTVKKRYRSGGDEINSDEALEEEVLGAEDDTEYNPEVADESRDKKEKPAEVVVTFWPENETDTNPVYTLVRHMQQLQCLA